MSDVDLEDVATDRPSAAYISFIAELVGKLASGMGSAHRFEPPESPVPFYEALQVLLATLSEGPLPADGGGASSPQIFHVWPGKEGVTPDLMLGARVTRLAQDLHDLKLHCSHFAKTKDGETVLTRVSHLEDALRMVEATTGDVDFEAHQHIRGLDDRIAGLESGYKELSYAFSEVMVVLQSRLSKLELDRAARDGDDPDDSVLARVSHLEASLNELAERDGGAIVAAGEQLKAHDDQISNVLATLASQTTVIAELRAAVLAANSVQALRDTEVTRGDNPVQIITDDMDAEAEDDGERAPASGDAAPIPADTVDDDFDLDLSGDTKITQAQQRAAFVAGWEIKSDKVSMVLDLLLSGEAVHQSKFLYAYSPPLKEASLSAYVSTCRATLTKLTDITIAWDGAAKTFQLVPG